MQGERLVSREIPNLYPYTKTQDTFLTSLIEQRYANFDFDKIEDETSKYFIKESHNLAVVFMNAQQKLISRLFARKRLADRDEIRCLYYEDLVHFAHNGLLEWEEKAARSRPESDDYINANNEAHEWLKIARLAEHTVNNRYLGRPRSDYIVWPK